MKKLLSINPNGMPNFFSFPFSVREGVWCMDCNIYYVVGPNFDGGVKPIPY